MEMHGDMDAIDTLVVVLGVDEVEKVLIEASSTPEERRQGPYRSRQYQEPRQEYAKTKADIVDSSFGWGDLWVIVR